MGIGRSERDRPLHKALTVGSAKQESMTGNDGPQVES